MRLLSLLLAGIPLCAQTDVPITRAEAEQQALKNNPRITASRLLALASGQVTREVHAAQLPQITGNLTAVEAADASRIGAGSLTSSRLFSHAGAGGTFTQLVTDFGHTQNLVANAKLLAKAQEQAALATQQDVLLATDQAFYRLLAAQSLLDVAKAAQSARGSVQELTKALTQSALKSDLDLNVASADYSQAQLLVLDAENAISSASADLAAILNTSQDVTYRALPPPDESTSQPPPTPASTIPVIAEAQAQRPDLRALNLDKEAAHKFTLSQELQRLPTISASAVGGVTPARPDSVYGQDWYAAGGVNLSFPFYTGHRIAAQTEEARLREKAAEQQAQNLSNTIAHDVRVAILAAQTAFQRISVTENFRDEAAQALSLAQTRYKLGLSSIVELSQAQLQSTQADVAAVNARYDYLMSLRTLDYSRGLLAP